MNKQINNLDEKELLKRVEELIDGKINNQKITNSFLEFCSHLFSIRPKTNADFQLSLKRELLKKHPIYFEKKVGPRSHNKIQNLIITIKEFITMKKTKRFALIGVPVTLVIALAIIFISVINPGIQTAKAMEIIANDTQVRFVIEEYNLKVQEVVMKGDTAYIILDNVDRSNVIVTVDMNNGTVGRIVKEIKENGDKTKTKEFEKKAAAMGMTIEEFKTHLRERYEAKAESMGMTVKGFKKYLIDQEKSEHEAFEKKAASNGMTVREYKIYLREGYEAKVESMGMTIEEFKIYLGEQKKEWYEAFKVEAEVMGMTEAGYKEYLGSQKK